MKIKFSNSAYFYNILLVSNSLNTFKYIQLYFLKVFLKSFLNHDLKEKIKKVINLFLSKNMFSA